MRTFALCVCACLWSSLCSAAERIPGTQVTVIPPESFKPSADFSGYMDEETGASIMVIEIPGPYQEAIQGLTAESLARQGTELLSSEEVKVGEVEGRLMLTRIESDGSIFQKWLLVFGDQTTVVIHATAEQSVFEKLSVPLREAILAAYWDPSIKVGPLEGLSFTVKEAGDLKFAFKMASGVALTRDGVHPLPSVEKPLVVVSQASDPEFKADADQKAYAHALLTQTSKLPDKLEVISENTVEMLGKKGYFVAATGRPEGSAGDIYFEISVLVEEGRTTQLFGRVAATDRAAYQPIFASLRNSIESRD